MAIIRIIDEAHQVRIDVEGRLAKEQVSEVRDCWQATLNEASSSRKFTVDISELTGYDLSGLTLLRDMYRHGTYLAARNARALVFLDEISSDRPAGLNLVHEGVKRPNGKIGPKKAKVVSITRAAAAGLLDRGRPTNGAAGRHPGSLAG